jgi:hypothetical protein
MRCPLPIDWLEYLEGAHSEALASHLPACLPCQLLVEELGRTPRPRLQPSMPKSNVWPCWPEAKPSSPSFGDIRWTAESLGATGKSVTRVLVLLVSDAWEESGRSWCDIVPLSTDIENATSVDLLIQRTDTGLGIPWRMLSRYQTIANIRDLGARIGELTNSGREIVKKALVGHAPEDRYGTPIEGSNDTRARTPEELDRTIQMIGRQYAEILESETVSVKTSRILSFEMHPMPIRPVVATQPASLAAATGAEPEGNYWFVQIPARGRIEGRVEHKYSEDELLFVIENVTEEQLGLQTTAWITVWAAKQEEAVTSQPFHPTANERVVMGRDLGVFPREIRRLELRLADET